MKEVEFGSFLKFYRKISGKSIDGVIIEVPAGNLSLWERLFEIYFVRLIGTPNQNSKYGADFGRHQVSSSRITRF
jgi:hypothetical protein